MKSLLVLLLLPLWALAQVEISPRTPGESVYPGDLVEVRVQLLDDGLVNQISPATLRKAGSTKTFLFMAASPWEKDTSGWHLQGKLVMGPEFRPDAPTTFTAGTHSVEVRFKGWMWIPQAKDLQKDFVYESVPLLMISWMQKNIVLVTILSLLLLSLIFSFGLKWNHQRKQRLIAKKRKLDWEQRILQASDIASLSTIWKDRDSLKEIFPHALTAQREFFDLLNGCQFKPQVSEQELNSLLSAKALLLSRLKEESRGV